MSGTGSEGCGWANGDPRIIDMVTGTVAWEPDGGSQRVMPVGRLVCRVPLDDRLPGLDTVEGCGTGIVDAEETERRGSGQTTRARAVFEL